MIVGFFFWMFLEEDFIFKEFFVVIVVSVIRLEGMFF